MLQPKISLLVPIYNVEKYIERCVISLFEQTYDNIEYVFVNDCTRDDSVRVLEDVISRYPHRKQSIIIVSHEKNRGLAAARNTGLANSTGEFISHVDSDDYMEHNAVELLVNKQLSTDADIVTGLSVMHTHDRDVLLYPYSKDEEDVLLYMISENHCIWNRLIRKSLYEQHGISTMEGVNYSEDYWVLSRLAYYASSFSFVDEVIYHYDCTREGSYMAINRGGINKKMIDDIIFTDDKVIEFFKDKKPIYCETATRESAKFVERYLRIAAREGETAVFKKLLAKLNTFDQKYWPAIGWNNGIRRAMSQSYYSCKVMDFGMRVYYKIESYKYN